MATDSAHASTLLRRARPTLGRLWQLPAFLLGVAALVGVWQGRTYWHLTPSVTGEIKAARQALDADDLLKAVESAQRVLWAGERYPQLTGEAHFLLGSARLRQADDANFGDPAQMLREARQHLELAEQQGVPEADQPRLKYRLAKTWLLLGVDPPQVIAALTSAADRADDPVEAYGLLADAYAKLTPPDWPAALEAVKQQIAKASQDSDPAQLARTRLRLGELHFQTGNAKEARMVLGRISADDAPPEVFLAARSRLARSFEESQEWTQAARNWEQVRTDPNLAGPAKGQVLYHLGLCYARDQRAREAAAAWEEALALGGEEAQAAALRLAEARLAGENRAAALDALDVALKGVNGPNDYKNALVPMAEVRQLFESAAEALRAKGDWESARKAARLYSKLAPPGRDDEQLAQAAETRAAQLQEQARANGADAVGLEEQARQQFRLAGQAYEAAAAKVLPGPERAEWLWRAGDRYLKARVLDRALDVFAQFTQLESVADAARTVEAWYLIGQTRQALGQGAAARTAFQRCLKPDGPFALRARHALAVLDEAEARVYRNKEEAIRAAVPPGSRPDEAQRQAIEQNVRQAKPLFDAAEAALQQNLNDLRASPQPDAAQQEATLFALAEVAYERGDYVAAEQRLQGVLQQYPDSASVVRARCQLGRNYWYQATLESNALQDPALAPEEKKRRQKLYFQDLTQSAESFEKVEELLLRKQRTGPLTGEEPAFLRLASYAVAESYFFLGKYDDAVQRYSTLALRYQGQVDELVALSQLWWCFDRMKQPEKVQSMLPRIKDAVEKMSASAWDASSNIHVRAFWDDWLDKAGKPAPSK